MTEIHYQEAGEIKSVDLPELEEKLCTCGDTEEQHIDGEAQCAVPECGCKEFEPHYCVCRKCDEITACAHSDEEEHEETLCANCAR